MDLIDPNPPAAHGITTFAGAAPFLELPSDIHPDSPRPDTPRPALLDMRDAAKLPDALMGGTRRMRREHEEWLPREEAESETNHRLRVKRSTCFPFYRDTLLDLAARPFSREVAWEQDPDEDLKRFLSDVDGTGRNITVFARDVLLQAMHRGMVHVLVDASSKSGETAATADRRRVYATIIDSLSMLDVRDQADAAGEKRVVYCRFVRRQIADTETFAQQTEVVIVELTKELSEVDGTKVEWRFNEQTKHWVASPATAYNPGKRGIPLETIYTSQTGHFSAEPLLEDLAWVNLAHFQSRSDHAHVMRIARLITLVTLGFPDSTHSSPVDPLAAKAETGKIVLGPLSRINSPKEAGKVSVSFLEPSGKSIELSFQDMEQLADEAKRLGARHVSSKTGNVTARAITSDDTKSSNNLQTFCGRLDVLLRRLVENWGEWWNRKLPAGVQPRVYKEFVAAGNPEGGARALRDLTPALSKRQLVIEATRYGILRPDFPVEQNLRELKEEAEAVDAAIAAAAGTPGGHDHPDPADDEPDGGAEDA